MDAYRLQWLQYLHLSTFKVSMMNPCYFSQVDIINMRKVCASGFWRPQLFTCAACTALKYTLMGDFMATFIALNGVCLNIPRHHHNILAGPGRCVLPAAPEAEFYRTLLRVFMSHHGLDFTTDSLIFSNTRLWPLRNAIYGIPRGPIKRLFCHGFSNLLSLRNNDAGTDAQAAGLVMDCKHGLAV